MKLENNRFLIFGFVILVFFSGCQNRTNHTDEEPGNFSVGGTISGLADGAWLVLQNNGQNDLMLATNGPFTFKGTLIDRSTYLVTVSVQPYIPQETCIVTNQSGTISGTNVTNVVVSCVCPTTIGWFSASSQLVSPGDSITLSWVTWEAASCEINPGAIQATPTNAANTETTINSTTTFTLTCQGRDGPVSSKPVTVQVTDTDWAQISSFYADYLPCAVKNDGRFFYLESYDLVPRPWNIPLPENTVASDLAEISMGVSHACAIKNDGQLVCWGSGEYGKLGNNSTSGTALALQEYTAATNWSQVSAGRNNTCAVKNDGRLFCWGYNSDGELGNNSTADSLVPVQEYTAATDWSQVSTGGNHTCAVKNDGRLFCWGYNSDGELGNNSTAGSLVPVQEYTAATDWSQVSAGGNHTCAVKNDGRLFCWGSFIYYQPFLKSLQPIQENTIADDWVQVSTTEILTCALKKNGRLFCWGDDRYYLQDPQPLRESTVASDWAQVSAGAGHTCAIKNDGRLFCWGSNQHGQLGSSLQGLSWLQVQESTAASDWSHVSAGESHTCAIKKDGRLFCWGANQNGQVGINSTLDSFTPLQEYTATTDWAQVSTGVAHTCAIKRDGRLFCWGANLYRQLGTSSTTDSSIPLQEYTAAVDWAQVSAGWHHTCAIKKDGRLFCWGEQRGQLFNNSSIQDDLIQRQDYTGATDWVQVSAAYWYSCALKTNGKIVCWPDDDSFIQLCTDYLSDWTQVSAGYYHTCAMRRDNRIFCTGENDWGQLGNSPESYPLIPMQEKTASSDWTQVSAGYNHTCAVKTNGKLFCWGSNESNQLSRPSFSPTFPTE